MSSTRQAPPPHAEASPAPVRRRTEVSVAMLFLLATAAFATGDSLLDRSPALGVALQALTGLAVLGTGFLLLPVLRPHSDRRARGYLLARAAECTAIWACGAWLLVVGSVVGSYTLIVYAVSGVAGVLLTSVLWESGLVPRWLAGFGILGYLSLLLGTVLDALGLVDLATASGVVFLAPGGLFEIGFPVLLLVRGFRR